QTLQDMIACEPLHSKICKAAGERFTFTQLDALADRGLELGVISDDEAELLRRTEVGRLRTINVDDFDPADLLAGQAAFDYALKNLAKGEAA
ncbi:MAG TPA: acyl-CoA dehydrogenase, partial [Idiomarina sp.]|nr:acyl-CoA dehydrogenase [Idiomarina sp.]